VLFNHNNGVCLRVWNDSSIAVVLIFTTLLAAGRNVGRVVRRWTTRRRKRRRFVQQHFNRDGDLVHALTYPPLVVTLNGRTVTVIGLNLFSLFLLDGEEHPRGTVKTVPLHHVLFQLQVHVIIARRRRGSGTVVRSLLRLHAHAWTEPLTPLPQHVHDLQGQGHQSNGRYRHYRGSELAQTHHRERKKKHDFALAPAFVRRWLLGSVAKGQKGVMGNWGFRRKTHPKKQKEKAKLERLMACVGFAG